MKKLKTLSIILLTALLIIGGMVGEAQAATWKNLDIYNNTGYTIKSLYLVPSGNNGWGEEQISARGYSHMPNNTYLPLSYNADYRNWWLRIVFMNGATREWSGSNVVNLYGAWKITLSSLGQDSSGYENFRWQKN